jgi:cytokinesis protein
MPTTASVPDKQRQSAASKSFFGRKLHKDKSGDDRYYEPGSGAATPAADTQSLAGSMAGSRSSRYSKRGSVGSFDADDGYGAFPSNAGILTSIPFDNMPSDSKTPIPVEYLPKQDPNARREPSPSHLAKGAADFHQYPIWDPKAVPNAPAHVSGPRPPPHASTMTTSSTGDRGARYQQWGRPGSSAANTGFSYTSSSTGDSSANSRTSLDQTSIYSSHSSATRGSYFSDSNSSRTLTNPYSAGDRNPNFAGSSSASRNLNAQQAYPPPQQPPSHMTPSSSHSSLGPEYLSRPKDDRVVDQLFLELMQKRGWQNLPEQAKRQMQAYPASKKWTLVHQDRLTELQGEQKRRHNARLTHGYEGNASSSLIGRADEEGSPEWYVKKVMDDTITSKQLASLSVSLRTQPIRYVTPDITVDFQTSD